MGNLSKGRYALFISDRSGLAYPCTEMVKEWNGARVHTSEYEPKQPHSKHCLLYTSPSPRDRQKARMPSSA